MCDLIWFCLRFVLAGRMLLNMVPWNIINIATLLVLADIALCKIGNDTVDTNNKIDLGGFRKAPGLKLETRRKKKERSTSSSSGEKTEEKDEKDGEDSLDISESTPSDSEEVNRKPRGPKKGIPALSAERKGWRVWHRKCPPCPEDMDKKWRDPSISWICGAYQRARRSFKSSCMMYYRNCQDGTMFTKIADHRCQNDTERYGEHFFYDYIVKLSDETSKTEMSDTSSEYSNSGVPF